MGERPVYNVAKPECVAVRLSVYISEHLFWRTPRPVRDLLGIWPNISVRMADEHVVEFMFNETLADVGAVHKVKGRVQFALEAHFFDEAALYSVFKGFARSRMTATGV